MRRLVPCVFGVLALVAATVTVTALPAGAAGTITATSVTLSAGDDCDSADLDIGLVSGVVDTETGMTTDVSGTVLDSFTQVSTNLNNLDGVFDGYGITTDGSPIDGSVIGTYASVGVAPLSAATAAEWFVLYRCGTGGTSTTLYSCFGDLGTCPSTAPEALDLLFGASLDPSTAVPGATVTVAGEGCFFPLAGARIFDGGSATGVGDVVVPAADGTFSIPLVVPASAPPDSMLTVQVDCGNEDQSPAQSVVLDLAVGQVAPTTVVPTTVATTVAPEPVEVAPAFTG